MADGVEVGRAHVTVTADARAAVRNVQSDFGRGMPEAGRKAGRGLGIAIASGLKATGVGLIIAGAAGALNLIRKGNEEAREAQKVGARTANVIKTTGGAAQVTAKQVADLSTAISNKTGIDDEAVQSGANLLLTFTKVRNEAGKGNDIFNQATQTVQDMSVAFDQSGKASAIQLGKALQDPIKGTTALARVGVQFTDQQKAQIKTLVESGNVLGAQKIILGELKTQVGGAAAASATASEKMRVGWANLQEQIGTALLPLWDKIATIISGTVIPAVSRFVTLVTGLGPKLKAVFSGGGGAAGSGLFSGLIAQARQLIAVIAPIVRQIVGALVGQFQKMRPQIQSIWTSVKTIVVGVMTIIREVISSVTNIIRMIWARWGKQITAIVVTVFRGMVNIISGVMKAIAGIIKLVVALIKGDWRGAWNAIKQIFSGVWQAIRGILTVATAAMRAVLAAWWAKVRALWSSATAAVRNTWNSFWTAIRTATSNALNAVFDRVRTVLNRIRDAFSTAKANIKRIWDGVQDVVSKPVRWIVDHVYNKPLVPVWNRVAGLVNGPKLSGYREGGQIRGPRHGRDNILALSRGGTPTAMVEPGEWVAPRWMSSLFPWLEDIRRKGKGRFKDEGLTGAIPGLAGGGIAGWMKGIASSVVGRVKDLAGKFKDWVLGGLRTAAGKVLDPVKGLIDRAMPNSGVGKTVGGVGKKAIDLVLDKIKSEDAKALAATTGGPAGSAIATGGWASIYKALRAVGARNFTTYPGHDQGASRSRDITPPSQRIADTARRLSSIWYVIYNRRIASITHGMRWRPYTRYGPNASPSQAHTNHVHVTLRPGVRAAAGGLIPQQASFDRGGLLQPGWTMAYNGTSRPEQVVPRGGGAGVNIYGGNFGYDPLSIGRAILTEQRHQQALNPVFA